MHETGMQDRYATLLKEAQEIEVELLGDLSILRSLQETQDRLEADVSFQVAMETGMDGKPIYSNVEKRTGETARRIALNPAHNELSQNIVKLTGELELKRLKVKYALLEAEFCKTCLLYKA